MTRKATLDTGDFSQGMVPDIIGAPNSMVDIRDGWMPRLGEIRKRGGKGRWVHGLLDGTFADTYRNGQASTELGSGALYANINVDSDDFVDPQKAYGFAFVGEGEWAVYRSGDSAVTRLANSKTLDWFPPNNVDRAVRFGGGDQIKNYGSILVSTGWAESEGDIRMIGKWGGALTGINAQATGVRLVNGSNVASLQAPAAGSPNSFIPDNFPPGSFISIGKATATKPHPKVTFMIVSATTKFVWLDRPWPGPTGNDYVLDQRAALENLDDPLDVGANAARAIEAHQDRLFGANYDPSYRRSDLNNFTGFGNDVIERQRNQSRVRWSAVWSENGKSIPGGTAATVDTHLTAYGENLWYPNAFFDVFPGQGGAITGLHSLGNELIVVKEDAVAALRGTFTSQNRVASVSADMVQMDNGAPSYRGSTKSEIGVIWANSRGLWVYNGGQAINLVDKVIENLWKNFMPGGFGDVVVSAVNNRIIVQDPTSDNAWIYHTDKGYFTRQECHPHSGIVSFGDRYFGDIELAVDDTTGNIVDWSDDFTEVRATDQERPAGPLLEVQTQPMPGGNRPFFSGRTNLFLVAGYFDSSMSASIILGRKDIPAPYTEVDDQVGPDATSPLEYGVEPETHDQISRISVGGIASRQAHQLRLSQDSTSNIMRVYGMGVEYVEDFTVDND